MDARHDSRPHIGMNVIDSNDHLLGTVVAVEHDHFVVGAGLFFARPQCIPVSAVSDICGHDVRLRITREAALHSSVDAHWSEQPMHSEIADLPPTDGVPSV